MPKRIRKPILKVSMAQKNLDISHRLSKQLGFNTTSEMIRSWLVTACEENGLIWDEQLDPVRQWGEHNRINNHDSE